MERIFEQIREWRQIPSYQGERRIDIFFGVFLRKILVGLGYFDASEEILLIPEFPQPAADNMRSKKIDYIAVSDSKLYAIELKTDAHSVRGTQNDYYRSFLDKTWGEHKQFVDDLKESSRTKSKYKFLQKELRRSKFPDGQKPTDVIYIAPDNTQVAPAFKFVKFSEIAALLSDGDQLFGLFKESLKNWD